LLRRKVKQPKFLKSKERKTLEKIEEAPQQAEAGETEDHM
jgi:hypothetical protein